MDSGQNPGRQPSGLQPNPVRVTHGAEQGAPVANQGAAWAGAEGPHAGVQQQLVDFGFGPNLIPASRSSPPEGGGTPVRSPLSFQGNSFPPPQLLGGGQGAMPVEPGFPNIYSSESVYTPQYGVNPAVMSAHVPQFGQQSGAPLFQPGFPAPSPVAYSQWQGGMPQQTPQFSYPGQGMHRQSTTPSDFEARSVVQQQHQHSVVQQQQQQSVDHHQQQQQQQQQQQYQRSGYQSRLDQERLGYSESSDREFRRQQALKAEREERERERERDWSREGQLVQDSRLRAQEEKLESMSQLLHQSLVQNAVFSEQILSRLNPEPESKSGKPPDFEVEDDPEGPDGLVPAAHKSFTGEDLDFKSEGDKAREIFRAQSGAGARSLTPKHLMDGSNLDAKFFGNQREDVTKFLEKCEDQLLYVPKQYWHVLVSQKSLGPKVLAMSQLYVKDLEAGRFSVKIDGNVYLVPAGSWGEWAEFKAWLISEYHKPGMDIVRIMEMLAENEKGQKGSFAVFVSAFMLEIKQQEASGIVWDVRVVKALMFKGMKTSLYNRLLVEPELCNGPLKELISIAIKMDEVEYSVRKPNVSVVEEEQEEERAELCRDQSPARSESRPVGRPPSFTKPWYEQLARREKEFGCPNICIYCKGKDGHTIGVCPKLWRKEKGEEAMPAEVKAVSDKLSREVAAITVNEPEPGESEGSNTSEPEFEVHEPVFEDEPALLTPTLQEIKERKLFEKFGMTFAENDAANAELEAAQERRRCSSESNSGNSDSGSDSDDEGEEFFDTVKAEPEFEAAKGEPQGAKSESSAVAGLKVGKAVVQLVPRGSKDGGLRIFYDGIFGGVPARVMLDSGADGIGYTSEGWVNDNIESLKPFLKECAQYECGGVSGAKMTSNKFLSKIPMCLDAVFEDEMNLKVLPMKSGAEYDVILGITWIKAYTTWAEPMEISTSERGLCLDAVESEGPPLLPYLAEGEAIPLGVFRTRRVSQLSLISHSKAVTCSSSRLESSAP